MRDLRAMIWQINTQAMQNWDIGTRVHMLENRVDQAYQYISYLPPSPNVIKGIFVVPEYYFANPSAHGDHVVGEQRHMDEGTKQYVECCLSTLSANHPGLLIIPGTIAWRKPIIKWTHAHYQDYFNSKYFRGKPARQPNPTGLPENRFALDYLNSWHNQGASHRYIKSYNSIQAYGVNAGGGDGGAMGPTDNHQHTKLARIYDANSYIARNSVYAYLNGDQVYKYHKRADFREVLNYAPGGDATINVPGDNTQPVFDLDGIRFGIEICLDHACQMLATPVNVHIILSAWVGHNVFRGTHVVHASSNYLQTGVWQYNPWIVFFQQLPAAWAMGDMRFYAMGI